ncbi:hypothetical protein KL912_000785 [Ogataea haglerorum]|nr:hypothetical protein KL912_000785 [Ogataea haglerorum]
MSLSEKSINTVGIDSKMKSGTPLQKPSTGKGAISNKSGQQQQSMPRPILFKSGSSASSIASRQSNLPPLNTTFDKTQKSTQPISQPTPLGDSVPYTPSTQAHTSGDLHSESSTPMKSASSISFQVPTVNPQKHRGSISARPSTTKLSLLESPASGVPSTRQPSGTHPPAALAHEFPHQVKHMDAGLTKTTPTTTVPLHSAIGKESREHSVSSILSDRHASSHSSPRNLSSPSGVTSPVPFDLGPQSSQNSTVGSDNFQNEILFQPLSSEVRVHSPPMPSRKKTTTTPKTVVSTPTGPVVPFTEYLSKEDDDKIHILIGATGSVATIKIPMIIDKLFKLYGVDKVSIQLVVTQAAEHFLRGLKISTEVKIWRENEEWSTPMTKPGDPILHVELRKWADIFLIAPLSANTLAKIANGIADNLLTSIIRVWNPAIPIIMAPAMNTLMYTHPITKKHFAVIKEDFKFIEVLKPIEKVLICGDIGMGGMREWSEIVDILYRKMKTLQAEKLRRANERIEEEEEEDEEDEEEEDEDDDDFDDDEDDDEDDDVESTVVESKPSRG